MYTNIPVTSSSAPTCLPYYVSAVRGRTIRQPTVPTIPSPTVICRGEMQPHYSVVVDWRRGNIRLFTRLGGVAVGSNLGLTLAACGGGKSLRVRLVYGLWCAHSFNFTQCLQRRRWVRTVLDVRVIMLALKPSLFESLTYCFFFSLLVKKPHY